MNQRYRKKLVIVLAMVAACMFGVLLFIGCAESKADNGKRVTETLSLDSYAEGVKTENVSEIEVGDLRIQLLSETLFRVEGKGPKGYENRASYIVSNRSDWDTVGYNLTTGNSETLIATAEYVVHVPNGAKAQDVYATDGAGNLLWEFDGMTDTNVYLPSPSDELRSWYFTDSPRIIPSGYGYSAGVSDEPLQGWDFDNDATDVFVFLPGGDYAQFCQDYTDLTGKSEMVSLQMLGYWDSRWYAYSAETAMQQIKDYQNKGYSIDVLVIDTDWRQSSGSGIGYDINTDLFPDMAAFLEEVHEMGINVCFNDHPEPVSGTTNGLDQEEVEYRNEKLTLILSLGLDYWWYDRNWSVSLNSANKELSVYAFGMYAYNWVTNEYLESITDLNEYAERALIMGNVDGCLNGTWTYASDLSAHRYSIQWTGDVGTDTSVLEAELYNLIFAGAELGLPYVSSDIGGHTQAVTDEMYIRWFQYGALSTICRVHCTNASYIGQEGRMPWLYGEEAEEVAHVYQDIRYRLLPLFYAESRDNYDTGLPVMQRLDIQYPQYEEASRNDEYLLGDYVLVAPIVTAEMSTNVYPADLLSHEEDGKQVSGLKAQYFTNKDLSGTPSITKTDSVIDFDWGANAPSGLGVADNFSVRWEGNVTIGDKPSALGFYGDDEIYVWIDGQQVISSSTYNTYVQTPVYAAGSTHTIRVEFKEGSGNAYIHMYMVEQSADGEVKDSRTVFIPDGTWIDVWTGERFVGPATYTVSHSLATSPIFVREGALIALSENMSNTNAADWSRMALEVYPSMNFNAAITLYEDDTVSDGYQYGEYRTTDITMHYDSFKQAVIVTINAAEGNFTGWRALEERSWNIRVHTNPGWGALSTVLVNGRRVSLAYYLQSADAQPFAFSGAAADGDLYEFRIDGSVRETYTIELYFDNVTESAINEEYDNLVLEFTLSDEEPGALTNFDSAQVIDYISYDANGVSVKEGGTGVFSEVEGYGSLSVASGGNLRIVNGNMTMGGISSAQSFKFEIRTTSAAKYYVLYFGGVQCTAKVTVRDRAGNVITEVFGDLFGTFTRKVVIECEGEGVLYVTYAAVASETNGSSSPTRVHFYGAIASSTLPDEGQTEAVSVSASYESATDPNYATLDLTTAGASLGEDTLDWMHFRGDGTTIVQRIGGTALLGATFSDGGEFSNYHGTFTYSDGEGASSASGTSMGARGDEIFLYVRVDELTENILIYTGTWRATNTVEIYTQDGELLCSSDSFSAGDSSVCRILRFGVEADGETILKVRLIASNSSGGNVQLAAAAVTGTASN